MITSLTFMTDKATKPSTFIVWIFDIIYDKSLQTLFIQEY